MIRVEFTKANQIYKEFSVKGHAGYATRGKDIICAAVSALVTNTVNCLEKFTDDTESVEEDESTGYILVKLIEQPGDYSRLLIDSLALGLENIKKEYGKKYLQVNYKEV